MIWIGLPRPQGGASGSGKTWNSKDGSPTIVARAESAMKGKRSIAASLWYLAAREKIVLRNDLFKECCSDTNFFCQLKPEIITNCTKEAYKKI